MTPEAIRQQQAQGTYLDSQIVCVIVEEPNGIAPRHYHVHIDSQSQGRYVDIHEVVSYTCQRTDLARF